MGKTTGFLEYPRIEPEKRPPEERLKDWGEIRLHQNPDVLSLQGARCMNCGVPFCHGGVVLNGAVSGCPLHNLIPEWNELVYRGQWEDAYRRLIRTNPFPEFTSRVCPAPCEGACTVGYAWEPVAINSLEYEIIERAFAENWVQPSTSNPSGYKVAVVGSGPAGLSTAHYLNTVGHEVTVFERDDLPGGLMMYGIPNMKLDKNVICRRIELMQASGIKFALNTEIGRDLPAQKLISDFDAVVLCGGSGKARTLQIEGMDLTGVHFAMDYLRTSTKSLLDGKNEEDEITATGKNVIIIGGGDTGTDCVATALRQNCLSVHQFEIMPEPPSRRIEVSNPWPEWPRKQKIDYGQAEAISINGQDPRHYLISTTRISGDQGHVEAIHTVNVNWFKNVSGKMQPVEIAGTEKIWPADLVLLALGFSGPEVLLADELKLNRDHNSNIKADFGRFETNVDKVFVAGDMRRGQSLVVWAIQEGKLAAREVDKYLTGASFIK